MESCVHERFGVCSLCTSSEATHYTTTIWPHASVSVPPTGPDMTRIELELRQLRNEIRHLTLLFQQAMSENVD